MRTTLKIGVVFIIVVSTGFIGYRVATDESFLASIRYRFYGWVAILPCRLYVRNINDTLFLLDWTQPPPVHIKVTWGGDTIQRMNFALIHHFAPPPSFSEFWGFDSTVFRPQILRRAYYKLVPVSAGTSNLIGTFRNKWRDTLHLSVKRISDKLVIEGQDVITYLDSVGYRIKSAKLERLGWNGIWPTYSVEISSDGKVVYTGEHSVNVIGKRVYSIPKDSTKLLFEYINQIRFFSFSNDYVQSDSSRMNRCPIQFVTVNLNDRTKRVRNAKWGPEELEELERMIDRVGKTSTFVR